MEIKASIGVLAVSALIVGCAARQPANEPSANQSTASVPANAKEQPAAATQAKPATSATTQTQPSTPGARVVKSRNGEFDGEIIGKPAPKSKFAKLQIGMTMREVSNLIGVPNDMVRHETGKRWIPFYAGNDAQRINVLYKGEGCLAYTGGNAWGGGENELIRITVDVKGTCLGE